MRLCLSPATLPQPFPSQWKLVRFLLGGHCHLTFNSKHVYCMPAFWLALPKEEDIFIDLKNISISLREKEVTLLKKWSAVYDVQVIITGDISGRTTAKMIEKYRKASRMWNLCESLAGKSDEKKEASWDRVAWPEWPRYTMSVLITKAFGVRH